MNRTELGGIGLFVITILSCGTLAAFIATQVNVWLSLMMIPIFFVLLIAEERFIGDKLRESESAKVRSESLTHNHSFIDYTDEELEACPACRALRESLTANQQVHIMQPFDHEKAEAGPEPHDIDEWVKLTEKHGQVVLSFEVLDDFIKALKQFRQSRMETKIAEQEVDR